MKKFFILLVLAVMIAGCMAGSATYTNVGTLNLQPMQVTRSTEVSDLSLAIAKPEVIINFKASNTLKAAISERIKSDALALACNLSLEMKKILIAKGFTVTEVFNNLNTMTFTQKRNTSALFTAFIKINIDEATMTELTKDYVPVKTYGDLASSAKISIATVEPLSGETIWYKNVPVENSSISLQYPYYPRLNATDSMIPNELVPAVQSLDGIFSSTNDRILEAVMKYVSVEEFKFLNDDIKKLKNIKRY